MNPSDVEAMIRNLASRLELVEAKFDHPALAELLKPALLKAPSGESGITGEVTLRLAIRNLLSELLVNHVERGGTCRDFYRRHGVEYAMADGKSRKEILELIGGKEAP